MTDMFIPKKEKIIITIEAIIYIVLIILASYFTICGNMFIRMVPMLYFLGIFGCIMFNKKIVTVLLTTISIFTFGCLIESEVNMNIVLLSIYSAFMIVLGETTGYILNLLYENFKLRKFIKYYHKIIYIILLILSVLIPVFLNNIVNSNMISYMTARKNIDKYINENYAYSEYYIEKTDYIPSYNGGIYEFNSVIDGVEVKLNYISKDEIADINMNNRKENLNRIANAGMNILLRDNNLTNLDVECRYGYSKVSTEPDIIRINIKNTKAEQIDDIVKFMSAIKTWDKFDIIDRIDVQIDSVNVLIYKKDLDEKDITRDYILNGMQQEMLDSREGK